MNPKPDDALLIAFARAASKAQEIEALLQEMLIAAEVANDTQNRSFENIAAKIEKLPLGVLREKFLAVVRVADPQFTKMWKEINEERIFLMHKFFNAFPITSNADKLAEAARRVAKIDALLDIGINGTSLGMKAGDELPMGLSTIERCSVIAECVVAPEMTALLKVASNQGKTIHTGIPMLEAQLDLMLSFMKVE